LKRCLRGDVYIGRGLDATPFSEREPMRTTITAIATALVLTFTVFWATGAHAQSQTATSGDGPGAAAVCSGDHQLDYVSFAEQYLEGEERQPERAVEVLTNGCDRQNVDACRRLADLYAAGTGVEADDERAEQLRERADDLEDQTDDAETDE
jgi:hypothetical protein